MLLYYHSWMYYNHFITTLYHFLGLTYWHSAKVPVAVFACFLLRRKSIPNGVQSRRNFLEIFSGPEDTQWAKEVPERWAVETTTHQGAPVAPGTPWCLVGGLGSLLVTSLAHWPSSGPKKLSKKFRRDWTLFGTDILRSKKQAKNSNWHLSLCQ
jgi:hypothetical protein